MPDYPKSLLEALEEGQVLPFVGAGVSLSVQGLDGKSLFPSWSQLLQNGADWLSREKKAPDAELVRALIAVKDPDYLRAAQHLEEQLSGGLWARFLKSQFDKRRSDAREDSLALARSIWGLGARLIITTNYDHVLHWVSPDRDDLRVWDIDATADHAELLRSGDVDRPTIWHLHGHVDNISNLILTPQGYSQLYPSELQAQPRPTPSWETLRGVLVSKSLLFVGFSLRDPNFIATTRWVSEIFQGAVGPHYALIHESGVDHLRSLELPIEPLTFGNYDTGPVTILQDLGKYPARTSAKRQRKRSREKNSSSKISNPIGSPNSSLGKTSGTSQTSNPGFADEKPSLSRKSIGFALAIGVLLIGFGLWAIVRFADCRLQEETYQLYAPEVRYRPKLVTISAGKFRMGSTQNPDEKLHPVEITRGFLVSATEVTQAQYHAVTGESPVSERLSGLERRCRDRGLGGDHPVFCVSWQEAIQFCNQLSALEGLPLAYELDGENVKWNIESSGYRLPTEAEWEYAALAGASTRYWFGESSRCLPKVAWFGGMDSGTSNGTSHPVAQKLPNPWGLHDVSGNVWEWVWDYFDEYPPQAVDPVGPQEPPNPGNPVRVWRGGSWLTGPDQCRHAFRLSEHPDKWYADLGFRIARSY